MKLTKDDLNDLMEILEEAESFRPLVQKGIEILKSYSDEIKEIPEAFLKWIVERRIAAIN